MIACGIDPGVNGAAVIVDEQRRAVLAVFDLPIVRANTLAWLDGGRVLDWLRTWKPEVVILEQVAWKRGDENKANIAALIRIAGGVEAIVTAAGIPLDHVMPQVWKRRAGLLGKDKYASAALASARLSWPDQTMHLVKHKDRAEAGLLCLYGRAAAAPVKAAKRARETPRRTPKNLPLLDSLPRPDEP